MKKFLLSLALVVGFMGAAVPAAEAHYPPVSGSAAWAYSVVYSDWNHWCGDGWQWWCDNRQSYHREDRSGDGHSYNVVYCWVNARVGGWAQWCVALRVTHGNISALLRNRYISAQG